MKRSDGDHKQPGCVEQWFRRVLVVSIIGAYLLVGLAMWRLVMG